MPPPTLAAAVRRLTIRIAFAALLAAVVASPAAGVSARTTRSRPQNTAVPMITGTPQAGQTLTATSGTWSGVLPITFAYQWLRCDSSGSSCVAVSAATSTSYSLTSADVGSTMRVRVTASSSAGSASVSSAPTSVVQAVSPAVFLPPSGGVPTISGTAQAGQTLVATNGSWSGTTPMTYAYQWMRCDSSGSSCAPVLQATSASDSLAWADIGFTIRVSVTATNAAGSASATSTPTSVVQAAVVQSSSAGWTGFVGYAAYRASDFAQIAATGVKRVRMDNPGASTITAAASYGIDVLPIAGYEPWPDLNGGRGDKYPPLPQYYQTWADRMIAQWQSLSNPPVAIEVWNEPWLTNFWQPTPDPSAYYNLVKMFATEAWKVWPNVKILVSADTVGSTNTTGTVLWRKYLLAADTTGFLNDPRIQPTTHNYVEGRTPTTVTSQPCYWDLDRFKCAYNDFKAHGHPDPQVWVTEYGWESDVVGEQNQAAYTTQALSIFKNSGMVAAAYSFFYKTGDSWSYDWLRPDNSAKPVVSAVKALITGG